MNRPTLFAAVTLCLAVATAIPGYALAQANSSMTPPPDASGGPSTPQPFTPAQVQQQNQQIQDQNQQNQDAYQRQQQAYHDAEAHYQDQSVHYADQREAYKNERARYLHAKADYDARYGAGAYDHYWSAHVEAYDAHFGPGAYARDFEDDQGR